jgi:hypothetical protein
MECPVWVDHYSLITIHRRQSAGTMPAAIGGYAPGMPYLFFFPPSSFFPPSVTLPYFSSKYPCAPPFMK